MSLRIRIFGLPMFQKALRDLENNNAAKALQAGLYAVANAAATKAKRLAPKRYGVLRGSIYATVPRMVTRTRAQAIVGAGGPAAAYALAQHEGTNGIVVFKKYTTPGTGPKYITRAIEAVQKQPAIFTRAAKRAWKTLTLDAPAVPNTPNQGPKKARRALGLRRRKHRV